MRARGGKNVLQLLLHFYLMEKFIISARRGSYVAIIFIAMGRNVTDAATEIKAIASQFALNVKLKIRLIKVQKFHSMI